MAFFAQRAARLHAGIIEFGGLADDDGPGADDEDVARGILSGAFPIQASLRHAGLTARRRPCGTSNESMLLDRRRGTTPRYAAGPP